MRPLPEPMDGEAARPPRSTEDTARIPRVYLDDDQEFPMAPTADVSYVTLSQNQENLLYMLRGWPGLTRSEMRRNARESNMSDQGFYKAFEVLHEKGLIEKISGTQKWQIATQVPSGQPIPRGPDDLHAALVGAKHRIKDDLPGPSRAELARLVRQVRALVIVTLVLVATLPFWVQGLYQLVY